MHSGKKWRSVLWLNEMHSGKKWWIRGFAPPSIIFILYPDYVSARSLRSNRPHSIYQYSNMALRLWGQNCKFSKFVLSLNSQKRLGYKENNTKYRSLSWKPRSHVRILIYRTWPIGWEGDGYSRPWNFWWVCLPVSGNPCSILDQTISTPQAYFITDPEMDTIFLDI